MISRMDKCMDEEKVQVMVDYIEAARGAVQKSSFLADMSFKWRGGGDGRVAKPLSAKKI